jgi:hypothetical protein
LQPWRAYTDTPHVDTVLRAAGINLDIHHHSSREQDTEWVLRHLHRHGYRHVRIEVGWGSFNYSLPGQLQVSAQEKYRTVLRLCQKYGMRPMLLLNGNSGAPCPVQMFTARLSRPAKSGDSAVTLSPLPQGVTVVVNRTGLSQVTQYCAAEILFTAIDGTSVTLSKPLPKAIPANTNVKMATLRYRPFGPASTVAGRETMEAWQAYTLGVASFAATVLRTEGQPDLGFDLEIWNELTFGSSFLSINNYYPKDQPLYSLWNPTEIFSAVVNATAVIAEKHPVQFAGVQISNGFANTIPWPASGDMPARIHAINKHPYPGGKSFPADQEHGQPIDALGREIGSKPAGDHTEGNVLNLTYNITGFPEYYFAALQTETLVRDAGPFNNTIGAFCHGHFCRGALLPTPVWVTEVNMAPGQLGSKDWNRKSSLAMKAKMHLRFLTFFPHKGVERVYLYNDVGNGCLGRSDSGLAVLSDAFVNFTLNAALGVSYPSAEQEATLTSPSLRATGRLLRAIGGGASDDGGRGSEANLTLLALYESHGHMQWAGSATDRTRFPPLYNRELFVWLPMRVNATRFCAIVYVQTRNITTSLPPEEYTLAVAAYGFSLSAARVRCYDPILDTVCDIRFKSNETVAKVELAAVDYPRLLTFDVTADSSGAVLHHSSPLTDWDLAFQRANASLMSIKTDDNRDQNTRLTGGTIWDPIFHVSPAKCGLGMMADPNGALAPRKSCTPTSV